MISRCGICGKEFDMLWPGLWVYRRERNVFCSWGCMRKFDGKEAEKMERKRTVITDGNRMEAIRIAKDGGNPREYLKGLGLKNPSIAWKGIQLWAERNPDAEKLANLQEAIRRDFGADHAEEPEEKEDVEEVTRVELVYDPSIAEEYRREQAEKDAEEPEGPWYKMRVISSKQTGARYEFDPEYGLSMKLGQDEIILQPKGWELLLNEIPKAMKELGAVTA